MTFSTILKWMGYGTAILSFAAAVGEAVKKVSDHAQERRQVEALLASERIQRGGHDYAAAWQTLDQAAKIDQQSMQIWQTQEDLAMDWLENIRVDGDARFADIVSKTDPVLTRGIGVAKTVQRQADLTAHLGWSYFLRSREGSGGLDPAASYEEAAKKDPGNPYAEAMWGHWILWNNGDTADASRHFQNALTSGRERPFVRQMQLYALLNRHDDASEEQVVRVANDIRKEGGSIAPDLRRRILNMYDAKLIPPDDTTDRFIQSVPPAEHVATFRWLSNGLDQPGTETLVRQGDLCVLEEAAGETDEARRGYEELKKKLAGHPGSLLAMAEAGSSRLTKR